MISTDNMQRGSPDGLPLRIKYTSIYHNKQWK
jgi:hypothetical protein